MSQHETRAEVLLQELMTEIDEGARFNRAAMLEISERHISLAVQADRNTRSVRQILKHIERICDVCGHETTSDGCAFCQKPSARVVQLAERMVAAGSFPQISASEGHELADFIFNLVEPIEKPNGKPE